MKLLYLSNVDIGDPSSTGILKKIYGQVNAFIKLQYTVDICFSKGSGYLIHHTANDNYTEYYDFCGNNLLNALRRKSAYSHLARQISLRKYDSVYIRFVSLDICTMLFLRDIRRTTKFIVLEIPTYPYIKEKYLAMKKNKYLFNLKFIKYLITDLVIRAILKRFINFIVLTIPKKSLWGIPVASIENGIDNQKILPRQKTSPVNSNAITLFAATNIEIWQGLDRLIDGLYQYKKIKHNGPQIKIKIAGEGSQKNNLIGLIKKYKLEQNVQFCGQTSGKDLDDLYNEADIAIGSLGRHRQKTNLVSTLKIKEYCAKGIPFIYSNDEPTLSGREDFGLKVPADDSPISFPDVIHFFNKIKDTAIHIPMRELSQNKYDWLHQIKIIDNRFHQYSL